MLAPSDAKIAKKLKRRINQFALVRKLVIYGSRARGDSEPESDLDVFIELAELNPQMRKKISEAAWAISLECGVVISTFAASTEAVTNSPLAADPILKTIESEGVPI